jgi:hypothetical protein
MASVLTIVPPVNDVAFDDALMAPCEAFVGHLYDEHGLVFDVAGVQYFVAHYRTTAVMEGCRVSQPRYGSITRLELCTEGSGEGIHTPWVRIDDQRPLPWTPCVWQAWDYFLGNVALPEVPPEMVEIVEQLRAVLSA